MRPVKSHETHIYTVWLTQANSIGKPYHSAVVLNIIESDLTHLRLMTHIQTSENWITSGSGYGLLFIRRQSVAWNYTELF